MARSEGASSRRGGPSVEKLDPTKATPSRRKKVPLEPEYVGVDLHRRRSVIVRMSPDGERLTTEKIDDNAVALAAAIAPAGPNPRVVVESCCGWYWAADVLAECGAPTNATPPRARHRIGLRAQSSEPPGNEGQRRQSDEEQGEPSEQHEQEHSPRVTRRACRF